MFIDLTCHALKKPARPSDSKTFEAVCSRVSEFLLRSIIICVFTTSTGVVRNAAKNPATEPLIAWSKYPICVQLGFLIFLKVSQIVIYKELKGISRAISDQQPAQNPISLDSTACLPRRPLMLKIDLKVAPKESSKPSCICCFATSKGFLTVLLQNSATAPLIK